MKRTEMIKGKKAYCSPHIEEIKLDNEISLQLASESITPPTDPSWMRSQGSSTPYQEDELDYDYETW